MYFPKVLKKSFSARHPQWKKILNTVITMESQVATLQCEPWLVGLPQPLKYRNACFWSPKCKGTIFMALVSGSQAYRGACEQQRSGSPRHVFSDKTLLCGSGSHWVCERGRKRHLLQLHQLISIQRCLFKWSQILYCVPWDTENTAVALYESMDFWRKL